MNDLEEALASLGLTGHEARVFAVLVRQSPASASKVAKTTGISRSSVYTTLDALVAKGLVGVSYQNEVKQFAAAGHDALMDLMRRERELATARVATAEELRGQFASAPIAAVPRIIFFEGAEGLQRVYLQMLREARGPGPMRILRDEFVWRLAWSFVHEDPWRAKVRDLKARSGLETRLLVNGSALEREKAAHYETRRGTKTRYLPEEVRLRRMACYVLDDVVSLLSFDDQAMVGIRIANRVFAEGFRTVFDALWSTAQDSSQVSGSSGGR